MCAFGIDYFTVFPLTLSRTSFCAPVGTPACVDEVHAMMSLLYELSRPETHGRDSPTSSKLTLISQMPNSGSNLSCGPISMSIPEVKSVTICLTPSLPKRGHKVSEKFGAGILWLVRWCSKPANDEGVQVVSLDQG
jgi:hypothetical protein